MTDEAVLRDRIHGCLVGVAAGDALGMPSSLMSRRAIATTFGAIEGFLPAPEGHPIHAGMVAGQVTDDTEQTLLIADSLLERRRVDAADVAARLMRWAEERGAFESLLVGPSSLRALHRLRAGVPVEEAGITGDTNGASMRIAAVGIFAMGELEATVDAVAAACLPTHNTDVAISGASAVAAVVGAAVAGESDVDALVERALEAARLGRRRGRAWYGASIVKRTRHALEIVAQAPTQAAAMDELYDVVGAGVATTETVPACLAMLKLSGGEPVAAVRIAANLGGDCDTTGAIVGAMAGALRGAGAFPREWIELLERVNRLGLESYADRLARLVSDR